MVDKRRDSLLWNWDLQIGKREVVGFEYVEGYGKGGLEMTYGAERE